MPVPCSLSCQNSQKLEPGDIRGDFKIAVSQAISDALSYRTTMGGILGLIALGIYKEGNPRAGAGNFDTTPTEVWGNPRKRALGLKLRSFEAKQLRRALVVLNSVAVRIQSHNADGLFLVWSWWNEISRLVQLELSDIFVGLFCFVAPLELKWISFVYCPFLMRCLCILLQ